MAELYALTRLPAQRTTLQFGLGTPDQQAILDLGIQFLEPIWDSRPHARLAAAELCRDAGATELAQQHLDAAAAAYAAAGDVAGVAGCELARGAWAAVPAGSPLTLGLALSENPGTSTSELDFAIDRMLAPLPDAAASAPAYERAEAGFRAAGAPRGLAMVELHRAAVAALHDDPAAALAAAERAQAAFARRRRPRRRPPRRCARGARRHPGRSRGPSAGTSRRRSAPGAARRGRSPGRSGIGLLFSHVGWRWLRRDADPGRALACHRLADAAVHRARRRPTFSQQTLGDRALAHDAGGDWEAALVAVGAALRGLPELQAQHPEWSEELGLREGELAGLVRLLAYPRADAALLERLRPALERARARYEASRAARAGRTCPRTCATRSCRGTPAWRARPANDLRWDAAFAPAYSARSPCGRRTRASSRGCAVALDAAAAAPDERRGRLEAILLLDARRPGRGGEGLPRPPAAGAGATGLPASSPRTRCS